MEEVCVVDDRRVEEANAQYNERVAQRELESSPNYHKEIFAEWGKNSGSPLPKTPGQLPRPIFEPVTTQHFFCEKAENQNKEKVPPALQRVARIHELQVEINRLEQENAQLMEFIGKQGRDLRDEKLKTEAAVRRSRWAQEVKRAKVDYTAMAEELCSPQQKSE